MTKLIHIPAVHTVEIIPTQTDPIGVALGIAVLFIILLVAGIWYFESRE